MDKAIKHMLQPPDKALFSNYCNAGGDSQDVCKAADMLNKAIEENIADRSEREKIEALVANYYDAILYQGFMAGMYSLVELFRGLEG